MELNNLNGSIAYCEAMGLSKCFEAYADDCSTEDICSIGFNAYSGYVYITLENGISICSMLGRSVDYLTNDFENDEELFFNSYEEAENQIRLTDEV